MLVFCFLSLFFILLPNASEAANRYWVGSSGGNFSDSANWSDSTGGGGGASAPVAGDIAIFDGGGVSSSTIDITSTIQRLTISAGYTGTITVASGVTFTMTSAFTQADGTFNAGDTSIIWSGGTGNSDSISGGVFNLQSATLESSSSITVSGGAFNGGSGNMNLTGSAGDLYITGGEFNFPNGNVTVADDLTISASATPVTENNTTLILASVSGSGAIELATSFIFTNITINSTINGYGNILSAGDTLTASSTLTLTNGFISGSGILAFTGPASGFSIASTFDGGDGTGTSNGNLHFTGTDIRNFTIDAGVTFPNFTLNAANTTVEFSGIASTTFEGFLNIDAGTFNASSTDITINKSFTQTGGTFNAGVNNNTITVLSYTVNYYGVTVSGGNFNLQTANLNSYYGIRVTAGTFDGGTGNMSSYDPAGNYGDIFITGGTFTFPNGTVSLTDDLTLAAAATIYENNTTLNFVNPFGSIIDLATTFTFTNLIINSVGSTAVAISSGDTLIVSSTLTLTNGATSGTGILEFTGTTLNIASTWDSMANGAFNLTGTQNQTIDLTGVEGNINSDININKTSGTVTLNSGLTMDAASQDLTIIEGTLDLNGNTLIVNGTSATMAIQDGGILRMQGGETVTTNASYPTFAATSNAIVYGAGTYTLPSLPTFYNLSFTGGGTYTLATSTSISNDLTLSSSSTLSSNGKNLTVLGAFSNDGTLRIQGGETITLTNDTDSGTTEFIGNGDSNPDTYTTSISDFYDLSINFTDSGDVLSPLSTLGTGLLGSWSFDNDAGLGTAIDDSSYSNDGVVTGATWGSTSGYNGNAAYTFAGSEYITISNVHNDTLSISSWVNVSDKTINQRIVSKTQAGEYSLSLNEGTAICGGAGQVCFVIHTGGVYYGAYFPVTSINNSTWYHLTGTYDGETVKIYLDGILQNSNTDPSGSITSIANPICIGAEATATACTGGSNFSGLIDDTRIYNRDLTPTEITDLAAGNTSSFTTTTITNNLTFAGGTYSAGGTINLSGNLLNTGGTFTANSSTLNLVGTDQTISGENTFYNLTKTDTSSSTLTFPASTTTTISNALTLTGSATTTPLFLRSSISDTSALIDIQGTQSLQYLDVKDMTSASQVVASCIVGCTDSGNNSYWSFGSLSIQFTNTTLNGLESVTSVDIEISLNAPAVGGITVDYAVSGGGATGSGTDYTLSSGTSTITNGNTTTSIDLVIVDDNEIESSETIEITISNPNGGTLGSNTVYTYTITDDDVAGVTINLTSVAVTEGSTTADYTAVLDTQPTNDVDVSASLLTNQVTLSSSTLTFTNSNWNTPQTITVTAINDDIAEGEHTDTISHTSSSTDSNFNLLTIASVTSTITDNETAGVTITTTTLALTEDGTTFDYTIQLDSEPTNVVAITLSSSGSNTTFSTSTITFTNTNWNTPQTITVTAIDNVVVDGTHLDTISHSAVSSDGNYSGISIVDVIATITDNDSAGVTIALTTVSVTEGSTTDSYTAVLDSQPTNDVTVDMSLSTNQVTISTSSITFTSANWNTPQTITITAVDDNIAEGNHTDTI